MLSLISEPNVPIYRCTTYNPKCNLPHPNLNLPNLQSHLRTHQNPSQKTLKIQKTIPFFEQFVLHH